MAYIDVPIGVSGICAHITGIGKSGSKVVLRGYAMDQKSGVPVGPRHQHTYDPDISTEKQAIQILVNIIEEAYRGDSAASAKKKQVTSGAGIFSAAYRNFRNIGIHNAKWNQDTEKGTYLYFERNILRRLDEAGVSITSEDLAEIKSNLIEKAAKNRRGNRNTNQAAQSVSKYLYRVNWILAEMYEYSPSIPPLHFDVAEKTTVPIAEQAKYIPNDVRVLLAWVLTQAVSNGLSMGVAAMLLMGTRTAEACAIKIGDIVLGDQGYVDCPVLWQMKNGRRISRLKTDSAYRHAIGGYLMFVLTTKRMEYLRKAGYTNEELLEMPLVSDSNDPCRYADPSKLSSYAKKLLLVCGYSQVSFQLAASLVVREPDLDIDGTSETDVTAYILRRDWVGRAMNVCGMTAADVDYLVGHKNPGTRKKDYTNPDIQQSIALQLERYVFLPEYSKHPYFAPACLKPGKPVDLDGYNAYCIRGGEKPMDVTVDIVTAECGESIIISTNGTVISTVEQKNGAKDSPEMRETRPLIGAVPPPSYYQDLEGQAQSIDISEFQ